MLSKTIARGRRKTSANRLVRASSGAAALAPAFTHVAREIVEHGKRTRSAEKDLSDAASSRENRPNVAADILMSSDFECLTAVEGDCDCEANGVAAQAFVRAVGRLVPSLPGPSGIFSAYGRVYIECGDHVELALRECSSPYEFALVVEQVNQLAAQATTALAEQGTRLLLTNNVHDGLLCKSNPLIWGCHENQLVSRHPRSFAFELLPFLSTRICGGAGGIEYPSGDFLAGVRANFMTLDIGGGTTHERALFSTSRDEHHMGENPSRFRLHLILGDGHRSQFNWSLHYGTTAMALKAIDFDRQLVDRLPPLPASGNNKPWVKITRRYNRLAAAGEPPRVDPLIVTVQRAYLDGARRWTDSLADPPDWMGRLLDDWEATLSAFERNDQEWLSQRLDPWIKHALFTEVLKQLGHCWRDVPGNKPANMTTPMKCSTTWRRWVRTNRRRRIRNICAIGPSWKRAAECLTPQATSTSCGRATESRSRSRLTICLWRVSPDWRRGPSWPCGRRAVCRCCRAIRRRLFRPRCTSIMPPG